MNRKLLSATVLTTVFALSTNLAFAQMPPPNDDFNGPKGKPAHHQMMSPQEKQQKIEEFEKRLNLTSEQKSKIEKNRKNSKKKLDAIRKKELKLKEEKKAIFEKSKQDFESILTDEQKKELKKIEQERFEKMKEKRKEFEPKNKIKK